MDEIVVVEGLVIAFTVILGFIINQAAAWAGFSFSEVAKKAVVFVVVTGLSAVAMVEAGLPELPDVAADPIGFALALLSVAVLNFKIAQPVYDKLWKGLLRGGKK